MLTRAIIGLLFIPCLTPIATAQNAQSADTVTSSPHYWRRFGLGVTASVLLHEAAHIGTSFAAGARPTFGFDKLRPTVYSGLNLQTAPRKQFWFSSAGLTAQSLLDEAILDIPHNRGSAFERGLLGGGIGTTLFYLTIGRTGSVSDVDYMARTRVMNKAQISLLYGGVSAIHALRISRNPAYANFFARPSARGLDLGFQF